MSLWDRVAMDLMGSLPLTPRGKHHILVAADSFMKWVEAFPVLEMSTAMVANVLKSSASLGHLGCFTLIKDGCLRARSWQRLPTC